MPITNILYLPVFFKFYFQNFFAEDNGRAVFVHWKCPWTSWCLRGARDELIGHTHHTRDICGGLRFNFSLKKMTNIGLKCKWKMTPPPLPWIQFFSLSVHFSSKSQNFPITFILFLLFLSLFCYILIVYFLETIVKNNIDFENINFFGFLKVEHHRKRFHSGNDQQRVLQNTAQTQRVDRVAQCEVTIDFYKYIYWILEKNIGKTYILYLYLLTFVLISLWD